MAEHKQGASGTLPKNIRQIGTSVGTTRVYLEDYVYTYLHEQQEQEAWAHRGFVLLGRIERGKDYLRYFISGLIRLEDNFFKEDILVFSDETWAHVFKEMKQYYDNLEIVGWGQDVSGANASFTAELERSHKQNFNIQKNVLFLLDSVENEEAFYIFEKNMLQRREGYYVYYEKNPQMQEYMIESSKGKELDIPPEEIQEPLVHSYREALLEKKAQLSARKWNGVLYTTSMLLVLSVCVLGVSTVNNVEKMQNLEDTVSQISGHVGQTGGQSSNVPAMSQNTQKEGLPGAESPSIQAGAGDKDMDGQDSGSGKDDGAQAGKEEKGKKEENSTQETKGSAVDESSLTEAQTYLLQGYYIVKKGDSLVGISRKIYGTPRKAKKICEVNGIEDMDKIYAGQRLELP